MSEAQDRPASTGGRSGKAIAFVSRDGRVVTATPSFTTALRGEGGPALTRLDELSAPLAQALAEQIAAVLDGGPPALDVALPAGPHSRLRAHVIATPAGAGGTETAAVVLDHDVSASDEVTERRRAEDALRQSELRFRQIAETIKDVFFITDQRTFELLYVNPAFESFYGRSRDGVYADLTSLIESIHPDDRARVLDVFQHSVETGHDITYRILRPDGSVVWAHDRGYPVRTPDGARLTTGLVTDITAERRLRDELLHAQKLESIGRLAGGIAHDFNNILTVVLASADIAASLLPEESPAQEELGNVRDAGQRAAALTQQLLAFARRQVIQPMAVDLNELARSMQAMLRRLLGEGTTLEMRLTDEDAIVWVDRSQLEQVLLNLAVNARDAMPSGGRVIVAISPAVVAAGGSTEYETLAPGDYVRLAVEDEGEGIPASLRPHIFEPFVTTKGRGAGLGLATSHGIVAQAGGRIVVSSEAGKGTIFEVLLPRAPRPPSSAVGTHTARRIRVAGRETILLVEDQAPVRRVAATILRGRGYNVLEAGDGVEALDVASKLEGSIHLLLTDVVMPSMGGVELAERLVALRPGTKVLFTSGFTQDADLKLSSEAAFLPKPYVMDTLLKRVRELLDGTAPSTVDARR